MQLSKTMRMGLCLLICLLYGSAGNADRIYLKDGTVVVSDKVWQTTDHVHFILQGTEHVEIRYANEIVAKIESHGQYVTLGEAAMPNPSYDRQTAVSSTSVNNNVTASEDVVIGGKAAQPSQVNAQIDQRAVTANHGLRFYDPRREKRYWASRQSKHDTLDGALQALARQYGRTSQWVVSHMGEENNLSNIHTNLIQRLEMEISTTDDQTNLDAVHRMTAQAAANKPINTPKSIASAVSLSQDSKDASYYGIEFYNPRREQKYWIGKMAGYNTWQDALQALANQYSVSAEWIDANMGNTNDLDMIHRNIRKSLQHLNAEPYMSPPGPQD